MDPASATSAHDDHQVMSPRCTANSAAHGSVADRRGTAGPDYGGARVPRQAASQPNGVPLAVAQRSPTDLVEMESLLGSPWAAGLAHAVTPGEGPGAAFFPEAWPAQPAPVRDEYNVVGGATRAPVFLLLRFLDVTAWRVLEDACAECGGDGTTLTRQQVMGAGGEVLSQERLYILRGLPRLSTGVLPLPRPPWLSRLERHNAETKTCSCLDLGSNDRWLGTESAAIVRRGLQQILVPRPQSLVRWSRKKSADKSRKLWNHREDIWKPKEENRRLRDDARAFREPQDAPGVYFVITARACWLDTRSNSVMVKEMLRFYLRFMTNHLGVGLRFCLKFTINLLSVGLQHYLSFMTSLKGVGLMSNKWVVEYQGQFLLFEKVLEYRMGIGLMTRLLVSEYRMQILLEVLEYRLAIGLMIHLLASEYRV
eukprot:s3190_g4.t2